MRSEAVSLRQRVAELLTDLPLVRGIDFALCTKVFNRGGSLRTQNPIDWPGVVAEIRRAGLNTGKALDRIQSAQLELVLQGVFAFTDHELTLMCSW
jgi:hypothetical protein